MWSGTLLLTNVKAPQYICKSFIFNCCIVYLSPFFVYCAHVMCLHPFWVRVVLSSVMRKLELLGFLFSPGLNITSQ